MHTDAGVGKGFMASQSLVGRQGHNDEVGHLDTWAGAETKTTKKIRKSTKMTDPPTDHLIDGWMDGPRP